MSGDLKKIVLIGPESTGKTTLCEQLASHFNTEWVNEHARVYLNTNGKEYTPSDLEKIAAGQIQHEEEIIRLLNQKKSVSYTHKPVVFIDTDLYVLKVWSEIVFNHCSNKILHEIAVRKYDLYLLCEPDIPWIKDELREHPDEMMRNKIFHHYKEAMINQQTPWKIINGDHEERLSKAINAVNQLLF